MKKIKIVLKLFELLILTILIIAISNSVIIELKILILLLSYIVGSIFSSIETLVYMIEKDNKE